ncbi:MAG: S41 family peptidase [Pseudomonadota bacterium]
MKMSLFTGFAAAALAFSGPGEAVAAEEPTGQTTQAQTEAVGRLIEVWNFVKYHHPDAQAGRLAMDLEFFALYPKMRDAGSTVQADAILADWVTGLGPGNPCDPCAQSVEESALALASPTPDWLRGLPAALSQPLSAIYANRRGHDGHFAVHPKRSTREAILTNKADYSRARPETDEALWALALARAWGALNYWFAYRDVMDESLETALPRAVMELFEAQNAADYQRAVLRFSAGADDGHVTIGQFYPAIMRPDAQCAIPYSLRYIEGQLVVDGRQMAGNGALQAGDVLVSIDGQSTETMADRVRPFIAASNADALGRALMAEVRLGRCETLVVAILRGGTRQNLAVEWKPWPKHKIEAMTPHYQPGETIETLPGGVTYVRYQQLKRADLDRLHALANAGSGLILDMRGYASDNMLLQLGGMLVDEPIAYARMARPVIDTPGAFFWDKPDSLRPRADGKRITVPVVALIDHSAQSAPEYVTMGWRGAGVPIIGSRSAGADGNVTSITLPGGGVMRFSGLGVFYPDKSPTQRLGIIPDIEVRPTIAGVAAGRDEVLERAIAHLASMASE